jgi:serine/threonine-protein kinase
MVDRGTIVGGYRIEELLGTGGMGKVFRARDVESGRAVALKLMAEGLGPDPRDDARFRGEGRVQALLEHPHVVTVYDAGESDHGLYLAMRLVDGPTLADLIKDRQLDARRALRLLDQVAGALDAAHAAGMVHRDVKPHNVLVAEGDHAYLADFGLTRNGGDPSLTASGALVGTVAYLAPEVVRGDEATPASDRYAFAAVAFECLTGSTVFPRASQASVLFAHAHDPPPRIGARRSELGDALDELFDTALAKEPSERPANAREIVAGIRAGLERARATELGAPPVQRVAALGRGRDTNDSIPVSTPPVTTRTRRAPLILAALAGAAVVAAVWLAFGRGGDEEPPTVAVDRPGLEYLGSALDGAPARSLDCRGRAPSPSSPACTVVQSALPGATVVVPRNGVIRNWQVRGARGELTLVVTRPRDGGSFQIATSDTETVGSADVQSFDADIGVERGDRVGVILAAGAAVGVRNGDRGTTTERWLPPVPGAGRPADRGPGTGFDHELLLRVGLLPGGGRRSPEKVTGSAAVRLPAGRVLKRRRVALGKQQIELALVRRGRGFAVDQFAHGRRAASMGVPGMRPGAQVVRFLAAVWTPEQSGLDVSFVNPGSARLVQRSYVFDANGFTSLR